MSENCERCGTDHEMDPVVALAFEIATAQAENLAYADDALTIDGRFARATRDTFFLAMKAHEGSDDFKCEHITVPVPCFGFASAPGRLLCADCAKAENAANPERPNRCDGCGGDASNGFRVIVLHGYILICVSLCRDCGDKEGRAMMNYLIADMVKSLGNGN